MSRQRHLRYTLPAWVALMPAATAVADNGQSPPLQLVPQQGTNQPPSEPVPGQLHDIHGPVPLPEPVNYLAIGLTTLVVLLVAAGLFWWFTKRKKRTVPQIPPAVVARDELMRARELMNPEQALNYMERVSTILRRYIEARFHLPAGRLTTREFLATSGGKTSALGEFRPDLQHCLEQCDMAKFAHQPAAIDNLSAMETRALQFINRTEPQPDRQAGGGKNTGRQN